MAPDVTNLAYDGDLRLRLTFEDRLSAAVDFAPHIKNKGGLCAALEDPDYFRQVRIDSDLHTIVWPNGYDIDPEVLYSWASGKPIALSSSPLGGSSLIGGRQQP
jgi:hypothetical protein